MSTNKNLFISYKTSLSDTKLGGETSYYSFDATSPDVVRVIILINSFLGKKDIEKIEYELRVNPSYIIFFSENSHISYLDNIVKRIYNQSLILSSLSKEDEKDAKEKFDFFALKLLEQSGIKVLKRNIKQYVLGDSLPSKEADMNNQPVEKIWTLGHLQRILMHTYVMQNNPEINDLDSRSYQIALARNTGNKKEVLMGYIEILKAEGLVDKDGKLRIDNGVFDAVKQKMQEDYDLDQKIQLPKGSPITGLVFLQYSHDRGKRLVFTQIVRKFFELNMADVEFSDHVSRDFAFHMKYKTQWIANVFCDVHSNSINVKEIGDVAIKSIKEIKDNPEKEIFEIICGSSFNREAENSAEEAGIHLLDSFSLLKLNKSLNNLTPEQKEILQNKFSDFFTKPGGYVSVRQGLENLFG